MVEIERKTVKLSQIRLNPDNPRRISDKDMDRLVKSLQDFPEMLNLREIVVDESMTVLGGNMRLLALRKIGAKECTAKIVTGLTPEQKREFVIKDNSNFGTWDMDALSAWDDLPLVDWGVDLPDDWLVEEKTEPADAEPQIDRAEELNKTWGVKSGDLYQIGEHRLLCGDSTKKEDVARVMGGEKAVLCHADPPYGMGKEKEGVANDNIYREKLDAFQMAWWRACRPSLTNNASAYIWGNAADLWRLWYRGGLADSERMTFRNEIIWHQITGVSWGKDGMAGLRMFAPMGERCLFFMLGEQGFNNNADNYWEGWDGIVDYLESQRQVAGWSIKDTKRIAGHSEKSGCHWFDKSQWSMPTREVYGAWQRAARNDAFKREYDELKREYDELKREFYATRAYFDNTHDNMTDVWDFHRVSGDERHGHATPKPVEMVARAIKSSSPEGAVVVEPFLGSGTTMVACQNLNRKCRGIEISENYCAVILQRMTDAFPGIEIRRADQ